MKVFPRVKSAFGRHRMIFPAMVVLTLLLTSPDARGDWIVSGNAAPPSGAGFVEITPPANNQVGAAWLDTPIDLNTSFDLSLVVNMGSRDSDGADGLSLVFQDDPRGTAALGDLTDGGRWIGVHGIFPALVVELDTWYNTENGNEFGDRPEDHVGVSFLRDAASMLDHAVAGPVPALAGGGDMEDGADHTVRLLWNSAATTLTVYVDGAQRMSFSNNVVATLFSGASSVWFGVTGSTGGAYNRQQFKAQLSGSELAISQSVAPAAVDPGDPVTYTVSLQNNSAVTAFVEQIEDQLPAGFVYLPGSTSGITIAEPTTGAQTLTWNGRWLLAPGQSQTLSFQVQSALAPGIYDNTATVSGDNFTDAGTGPTAPVTVRSGSNPPATGIKPLYLYSDPGLNLSRNPPEALQSQVQINRGWSQTWDLNPPLASPLTINAGTIPVDLWIAGDWNARTTIELSSASLGRIGAVTAFNVRWSSWQFTHLDMVIDDNVTLPAGDTLRLTISNVSSQWGRTIYINPYREQERSHLDLDCSTVVNVDSVLFLDAPYAGGSPVATASAGQTVSIRATVSDPFGSFDISSARLVLTAPGGAVSIDTTAWTSIVDSGGATRLYEYLFTIPAQAGQWRAEVTAEEGSEGLVHHTGAGSLQVFLPPSIMLLKSVRTFSDPLNGSVNAKAIPGAVMEYTITAVNSGGPGVDSDSIVVSDIVPANTALYVGDLDQPAGPVVFIDGPPVSGLVYTGLGSDIAYANGGPPYIYTYTPVPDALGIDDQVTAFRINPKGIFNPSENGSNPQFSLRFRVRLK